MQEFAWLRLNQFRAMAEFVGDRVDERKLRLAACGCVRRLPQLLEDARLRSAFELTEAFADYRVSKQQLKAARPAVLAIIEDARQRALRDDSPPPETVAGLQLTDEEREMFGFYLDEILRRGHAEELPLVRAAHIVSWLLETRKFTAESLDSLGGALDRLALANEPESPEARWREESARCDILRDVVGNPFRPVPFVENWRSDTAMSLARVIYETRDFGAMPILADALQDMGCENADVLDHCRGGGVHLRGCWVVDWVLGKS